MQIFLTIPALLASFLSNAEQTLEQRIASLDKQIASYKKLEASQQRLYEGLKDGSVLKVRLVKDGPYVPMTVESIRNAIVTDAVVKELGQDSPDVDRAEREGLANAEGYIKRWRERSGADVSNALIDLENSRRGRAKAEKKRDSLLAQRRNVQANFHGSWSTSYGSMELVQSGSHVTGKYFVGDGTLEGEVGADGHLKFKWTQKASRGVGEFILSADGKSFTGNWHYLNADGSIGDGAGWNGSRKQ